MTCYRIGGCGPYEMRPCSECPASKLEYLNKNKSEAIETTPEYFASVLADETNVQNAIYFLQKLGIQVKTEYGNYRPTYDVLKDIGDVIEKFKTKF